MEQLLPQTRALLGVHLGRDLAGCVVGHVASTNRDWRDVARCGEYETSTLSTAVNRSLCGACIGGHLALAKSMFARGASAHYEGFIEACGAGHLSIAHFMIAKGADGWRAAFECKVFAMQVAHWNLGLYVSCKGGHVALANLMISQGARDVDTALCNACKGNQPALADLMIAHGAKSWYVALYGACEGGHLALAKSMIAKAGGDLNRTLGDSDLDWALGAACEAGHVALAKLMVDEGATHCWHCNTNAHWQT